ncbi:MAG: pyruvate dehydrogenase (acetyl-transferring) E1 component subunit alpha [SAR202 cluster bacterium]|nr:pyruvate dehydrogenase (acetyl-transferring) E1 component subunit alpha [SAR202 cluster bacterium]
MINKEQLIGLYYQIALIRLMEERSGEMYMRGKIRGFLHLYIGEEAIAVGTIAATEPQDYIITHYRDHGHAIARGIPSNTIMAELYGKASGCSGGRGGSMHLFDSSRNFAGGHAIVGGQLPIALGLAIAAQKSGKNGVVLCYFGDGVLNQGEFHESMNLASVWKLPILFVLENNLYGMGSHIERVHSGGKDAYKIADYYRIPSSQVDGMDVLKVKEATEKAINSIRAGKGPFFMEALTWRFQGHSVADPQSYRTREENIPWLPKDPLTSFRAYLLDSAQATAEELDTVDQQVQAEVDEAVRFAEESPYPENDTLLEAIYSPQE